MSFAISEFYTGFEKYEGPTPYRGEQIAVLRITGTTADIDLDIGDNTGTFWTAAIAANSALANAVLSKLQEIVANSDMILDVICPQLKDRVQKASSPSNGEYVLTFQDKRPNILFNTSDGETSYCVKMVWRLAKGAYPVANVAYPV